ncbi:MAG: hypothetical protein PHW13_11265 [Methylococcales bacterium]|nr:hypothetical protein [Methylococcales bacterium]
MTTTSSSPLEMITPAREERPNRMCVVVSDLHFTDGTVGTQNLGAPTWNDFYNVIMQRSRLYALHEVVFVMDGDSLDMIRSGK